MEERSQRTNKGKRKLELTDEEIKKEDKIYNMIFGPTSLYTFPREDANLKYDFFKIYPFLKNSKFQKLAGKCQFVGKYIQ